MKKLVLCGVILSMGSIAVSSAAMAGPKWKQWGRPMSELSRGFERIDHLHKFESSRYEQPLQWENAEKELLLDVSKLYTAGIIRKQYFDKDDVATIEVGSNFYHLSGADKRRVVKSFDTVYNRTAEGAHQIRVKDWKTRELIGEYGPEGLYLQ